MKRIAIKLVIFLLLGAVVNVAVTYGVLLRIDPVLTFVSPMKDVDELPWPQAMPIEASHLVVEASPTFGTDRYEYVDILYLDEKPIVGSVFAMFYRSGWPLRSFEGGCYRDPKGGNFVEDGSVSLHRDWQERFWAVYYLPWRPSWIGLTINTLFYGVFLWLLWSAPFAARRLVRRRRGRCVRCGYDLRHAEHDVCPECGA
ncbi:MAG: hypothetical protein V3R72_11045 [Gammaproteobacteria bacterium]